MKKKICLIVSALSSGGVENFIKNYFSLLNKEKFDMYIITHNKPEYMNKKTFEDMGFKIISIPSKKENFFRSIFSIKKIMKENEFDIVHSHMIKSNFIFMYYAKKYNVNIRIAHSHDSKKIKVKEIFLWKLIQYLNRKYSNIFLGCSSDALEYGFGKKIFNSKYVYKIIYNAINIEKYTFKENYRNEIRKKINIDKDDFVIGNIARFSKQKNHEFLIRIIEKYVLDFPNDKFVLIGDGKLKTRMKRIIEEKKLINNVIFLDPTNDIYKYYSMFDIFVLPSLYEGLGMVLIEAQANGLMCLASNTIPQDVKQSELIEFLSINNEDLWIKKISSIKANHILSRKNCLINSNYDIKEKYIELEKIYTNDIGKEK